MLPSMILRARRWFLLVLCALDATLFLISRAEAPPGVLRVSFLDVGQGDAVYTRAPSGNDMLIDGGPSDVVLRSIAEAMPWGDRAIDAVIATHPDADHIGGLPSVLSRYDVGMLFESGAPSKNGIEAELHRLRDRKGVESHIARRGMRIDFGDGAVFDIFSPDRDMSTTTDTNLSSIVGELRYGSTSIMLTGDAPREVERRLVSLDGVGLRSDVLKAGHHGSHTSSDEAFVRAVGPSYAVISVGKDNRYGHPHQDVLAMFERLGVETLRTDERGTIELISDGSRIVVK